MLLKVGKMLVLVIPKMMVNWDPAPQIFWEWHMDEIEVKAAKKDWFIHTPRFLC